VTNTDFSASNQPNNFEARKRRRQRLGLLTIVSLILLAGLTFWLSRRAATAPLTNADPEITAFAFTDTANVTKLFLADRQGNKSTLVRSGGDWILNGSGVARPDAVNGVLGTIFAMRVRGPVAKAAQDNVIRQLAASGVKLEIYTKEGLAKTYYIGGPTTDMRGTYMMLEDGDRPYILQLPGMTGYLTPRFFASDTEWRRRIVFTSGKGGLLRGDEVNGIQMIYKAKGQSFGFERAGSGFKWNLPAGNPMPPPISGLAESFLKAVATLPLENFAGKAPERDSVLATQPELQIQLKRKDGSVVTACFYPKIKPYGPAVDASQAPIQIDPDRVWVFIPNPPHPKTQPITPKTKGQFATVQRRVFEPLLISPEALVRMSK